MKEKAKKKLGRPFGTFKENKLQGTFLNVRLNAEVKKEIERQASIEGLTLTAFLALTLKKLFGGK
jgi:hypothetical protein